MATIRARIRELVDDVVDRAYTIRLSSIATIGARELLDFGAGVLVSTIGLELLVTGEIGIDLFPFALIVVAPFWVATLALRSARRRFDLNYRLRAVASFLFALTNVYGGRGLVQFIDFYGPLIWDDYVISRSVGGRGVAASIVHVVETTIRIAPWSWNYLGGALPDLHLGIFGLVGGLAHEGTRRGLSRLDRGRRE